MWATGLFLGGSQRLACTSGNLIAMISGQFPPPNMCLMICSNCLHSVLPLLLPLRSDASPVQASLSRLFVYTSSYIVASSLSTVPTYTLYIRCIVFVLIAETLTNSGNIPVLLAATVSHYFPTFDLHRHKIRHSTLYSKEEPLSRISFPNLPSSDDLDIVLFHSISFVTVTHGGLQHSELQFVLSVLQAT
jgi:hypothetical protein